MQNQTKRSYRRPGLTMNGNSPDGLKNFAELPGDALVAQPVVEALFGCSAATVWRHVKGAVIPAPLKFGGSTRWRVGDLREALGKI